MGGWLNGKSELFFTTNVILLQIRNKKVLLTVKLGILRVVFTVSAI